MQQDMSNLTLSSETGQSVDLLSMPRSPQWPEVQRACLEKITIHVLVLRLSRDRLALLQT